VYVTCVTATLYGPSVATVAAADAAAAAEPVGVVTGVLVLTAGAAAAVVAVFPVLPDVPAERAAAFDGPIAVAAATMQTANTAVVAHTNFRVPLRMTHHHRQVVSQTDEAPLRIC
jgi:hypothetical protein